MPAGALVSTLAACGVTPDAALAAAHQLALEYQIFERPLGLAGVWGGLVRTWLDVLLPADAHTRCSGRVKLVVTEVSALVYDKAIGFKKHAAVAGSA